MSTALYTILAISACAVITFILWLIKRGRLAEEYSLIWISVSIFVFFGTVLAQHILAVYAFLKGDDSGPRAALFFAVLFIVFFLIFVSIRLSDYKKAITKLTMETAMLRQQLESRGTKDDRT